MARGRKPEVSIEQANDWLRRNQMGDSIAKIAKDEKFDVRTVKKYVDQADERYEGAQARTLVLKNALELHFKDLIDLVKKLDKLVTSDRSPAGEYNDPLFAALKEHQSGLKLWALLDEWDSLINGQGKLRKELQAAISEEAASDKSLLAAFKGGTIDSDNIGQAMMHVVKSQIGGFEGIRASDSLESERSDEPALVIARHGAYAIGTVKSANFEKLRQALTDFENKLPDLKEYLPLKTNTERQPVVKQAIHDLLQGFVLRRVVGGRCRYCPA